jgi:hypothetical protein
VTDESTEKAPHAPPDTIGTAAARAHDSQTRTRVFLRVLVGQSSPGVSGPNTTSSSAFGSVHDFFHSTGFEIGRNLALFMVVVFWLGLAFWVYRDARRRIYDGWLVATATLLGLVPFVGPLVYLLFRPPETLADAHARAIEIHALESRLLASRPHCPVCRSEVEASFIICPVCTTQLKEPCRHCSKPLERLWQACPYCATPVQKRASTADLDAALTAEALLHANGNGNGKGRKAAPPRPRGAAPR